MSTLGAFCKSGLGAFIESALHARGCATIVPCDCDSLHAAWPSFVIGGYTLNWTACTGGVIYWTYADANGEPLVQLLYPYDYAPTIWRVYVFDYATGYSYPGNRSMYWHDWRSETTDCGVSPVGLDFTHYSCCRITAPSLVCLGSCPAGNGSIDPPVVS